MITFSTKAGAACAVNAASVTFEAFPEKPSKDTWTFLSHPEEELTNKKVVSWPGEYDFSGISVRGIGQEDGRQISYVCHMESVRVAFIDGPVLEWTDSDIERLGEIDVLVIAAENPKKVLSVVEAVEPRLVLLFEVKDGDLAGTLKACGAAGAETVDEFKVKAGSLPQDSRQIVVLG